MLKAEIILDSQVRAFEDSLDMRTLLKGAVKKALLSGAIDNDAISYDDKTTAKVIFGLVLSEIAEDFKPVSDEGTEIYNNLKIIL